MKKKEKWEAVIGLEMHVQLNTRSKMFSGAGTVFGAAPNSYACPVDLALPGTLPVLNEAAVRMAVMFGLAIGAQINRLSRFDRKNYFYPDLPKGYQISQFAEPIVGRGTVEVPLAGDQSIAVGITRAHLEEDAGKSTHDAFPGETGIDLNRAGTPLLEVVCAPDLRTPAQATACFRSLHRLVRHLKICDGDLSQGSMRCDANVSVRPDGESELGERIEIKNLNSFRFLEKAVRHEINRQIELLENGGTVARETRLYDPQRDETRPMRGKEFSDDYRYFPDPDLLPLRFDDAFIESVRRAMPELPEARYRRYREQFALSDYAAARLTKDPDVADYFEAAAAGGDAKLAANWVTGELTKNLNRAGLSIEHAPVTAEQLGKLIARIKDGSLSGNTAKSVFDVLWRRGKANPDSQDEVEIKAHGMAASNLDPQDERRKQADVDAIIDELGLRQISDSTELEALVDEIVASHPQQANQFRAGKQKLLGFFIGQVMQATEGKADPKQTSELVAAALRPERQTKAR